MKVGIFTDLRFTALDTPTGVTKHIIHIVRGLFDNKKIQLLALVTKDQLGPDGKIPKENALSFLEARALPHSWKYIYWSNFISDLKTYDKFTRDLDYVYCPKNDYLPLTNTKYISTFHGAHEIDPDYNIDHGIIDRIHRWRSRKNYCKIVNQAFLILTVSEFLKSKTVQTLNVPPSKLKVVGNGVEEIFFNQGRQSKYSFENPFLAVGGMNIMDGGDRIIEIAKELTKKGSKRKICVVGNQHEEKLLQEAKQLGNIELLGYLKEEKLAHLMANASALLFFTTYETFGIAGAEALAVGLPVITRKSTAVPEILGDSAFYINDKVSDLEPVLADKASVLKKIREGKKRAENFHWHQCVTRVENVFLKNESPTIQEQIERR